MLYCAHVPKSRACGVLGVTEGCRGRVRISAACWAHLLEEQQTKNGALALAAGPALQSQPVIQVNAWSELSWSLNWAPFTVSREGLTPY